MHPKKSMLLHTRSIFLKHLVYLSIIMCNQWRQSKYIFRGGGDRGAEGAEGVVSTGGGVWGEGTAPSPEFFLILDLKMAICGALLVQFFAV